MNKFKEGDKVQIKGFSGSWEGAVCTVVSVGTSRLAFPYTLEVVSLKGWDSHLRVGSRGQFSDRFLEPVRDSSAKNARDMFRKLSKVEDKLDGAIAALKEAKSILDNEGYAQLVTDTTRTLSEYEGAIKILRRALITEKYAWESFADARSRR